MAEGQAGDICQNHIKRLRQINDEEFEYIDISSIDRSARSITESKVISRHNAPSRAQQVIEHGDVLVSTVRPNLNAVAMVGEKAQFQRVGSTGFCVLRAVAEKILPSFVFRVVQSEEFINSLVRVAEKAAYPSVTDDEVKAFQFPLPPLSVQREIVARLEKELGEADKLAAKFKRVAELADDAFKAELDETFKTLEDNSRRDAETRRVRLGDVCSTSSGGTPLRTVKAYYEGGTIPWLRSGEVSEKDIKQTEMFISQLGMENSSAKMLKRNAVVVAMYGATAGQVGILRIEATTNQAICAILPADDYIPEFMYYQLCGMKKDMVAQAQGGAQPNISQIKIKNLIISFPHLDAQREIVEKLDAAKDRCEKLKAAAMRGLAAAENLRKAILAEAFEQ